MKLSNKLSLFMILVAGLPILLLSFLVFYNARQFLLSSAVDSIENVAKNSLKDIETAMNDRTEELVLLSNRPSFIITLTNLQDIPTEDRADSTYLEDLNELAKDELLTRLFSEFIILDENDQILISQTDNTELYVDKIEVSNKDIDIVKNINQEYRILFSQKVVYENSKIATLVGVTDFSYIHSLVSDYTLLGESGEILLFTLDENGNYLFLAPPRFNLDYVFKSIESSTASNQMEHAIMGESHADLIDTDVWGKKVISSVRHIPSAGWGLIVKLDRSEALSKVDQFTQLAVVFVGLSAFLALSSGQVLSLQLLVPIKNMAHAAEMLSKGEFSVKLNVGNSKDELGLLANTFNTMSYQLSDLYDNLEKKIAERTRELKKFQQAVKSASDLIMITDTSGVVIYTNPAVEAQTGYAQTDIIGKKVGELWNKKQPNPYLSQIEEVVKTHKSNIIETVSQKRDGTEYIAEVHISPVDDGETQSKFISIIERDITLKKKIDQMKTEFVSLVSHQLKTPLTATRYFSEMLLDEEDLDKDQKDLVLNVYQSNMSMIKLVNNLLNISRLESGRLIIEPENTNIADLINQVLIEVKPRSDEKKQTIQVAIPKEMPAISIDRSLIAEAIKNYLTNAIKYSPEESKIKVSVETTEDDMIVNVQDEGFGIPKKEQEKVFARFFRSEETSDKAEGTGLGLYLVKLIMDSSGGKAYFVSEPGKGSTFSLSIPLSGSPANKGDVKFG